MHVVGEAGTGRDGIAEAQRLRPDVVVLDLGLPDIDGVEVTRQLRRELADLQVVILTSSDRDDQLMAALRAGAKGYVLKTSDFEELVSSLESIAVGEASLPPEVMSRLLMQLPVELSPPSDHSTRDGLSELPVGELSERELDILRLLVTGARNREIAAALGLRENTVRSYLTHIMQKLNVDNRVRVAMEAVRRGLVPRDGPNSL
jgi:two-component system NarL family response regulator